MDGGHGIGKRASLSSNSSNGVKGQGYVGQARVMVGRYVGTVRSLGEKRKGSGRYSASHTIFAVCIFIWEKGGRKGMKYYGVERRVEEKGEGGMFLC